GTPPSSAPTAARRSTLPSSAWPRRARRPDDRTVADGPPVLAETRVCRALRRGGIGGPRPRRPRCAGAVQGCGGGRRRGQGGGRGRFLRERRPRGGGGGRAGG